jgi:rRNA maturation RNase YbeY
MSLPVTFSYQYPYPKIDSANKLKSFLNYIIKQEGYVLESLSYVFCTDDFLLNINRQFLQHDYYTDIITFDYSTKSNKIYGELYISIDRVKENAKSINTTYKNEIHRVIIHGLLHLCGYKDKTAQEINTMRTKEDQYLNQYFL